MRFLIYWALLVISLSCQTQGDPSPEEHDLLGIWNVTRVSGGPLQFGIELSRIEGNELHGTVRRILSGNVELDVSGYTPIRGRLTNGRLLLDAHGAGGETLHFDFSWAGDSLEVISVEWSGEALVGPDRPWRAWRGE